MRYSTRGWGARSRNGADFCPVPPGVGYLDGPRRPEVIAERNRRVLLDAIGLPDDRLRDRDREIVDVIAVGFTTHEVDRIASLITQALGWAADWGGVR